MATTALEILPLADAKTQLRILGTDDDERITFCIEAAVGHVQHQANLPLLDVEDKFWAYGVQRTYPITLPFSFVRSVDNVAYWGTGQMRREDPTGTVPVVDLGRMEVFDLKRALSVWPPDDGWPTDRLIEAPILFTVTRGVDSNPRVLQALVLVVREFFEGRREKATLDAASSLIASIEFERLV